MSKPITLYSHHGGPNPWKVAIILEELGIQYESIYLDLGDLKKEPYVSLNPNGRVPCIVDPNTNVTLWESGAIIEYLIATYDTSHTLSFDTSPEKFQTVQFLHYQMSGQGPYFGQAAWFQYYHAEKVPSAVERYQNEIRRVLGVLDGILAGGKEYLVGGKCTYADLAFLPWSANIQGLLGVDTKQIEEVDFPNYGRWMKRLSERPAVKKAFAEKARLAAK